MNVSVSDFLLIGQLILLEGLLSFDNALALAALVKKKLKDETERKRALTYGIWGAYFFRILVIFIGVWLMKYEWVKAAAGGYLVWMFVSEILLKKKEPEAGELEKVSAFSWEKYFGKFWGTVVAVEIMDIMFSIDSIGVALAVSDKKWVLVSGAVLGILMMRFSASIFVNLIDKFPVLEKTAFILVGIAGLNVLLKLKDVPFFGTTFSIDKPIPEHPFLGILFGVLVLSMALNYFFPQWFKTDGSNEKKTI